MLNKNERMEKLQNAGVNTGHFFNVVLPEGLKPGASVQVIINENGQPIVLENGKVNNDPILSQIIEDGYVRNTKLHRRWVMAQMFRMLNSEDGYDQYLRRHYGYMYQFDMMLEEMRVLSELEIRDLESFTERSHFFTKAVVVATCNDYLEKLQKYVNGLQERKCKGVPYKKVKGINIFTEDLNKKVYQPVRNRIWRLEHAKNYKELYKELKKFRSEMVRLPYETKKCKVWIDAFKGSGSYYTLKNLVMFHNCRISDCYGYYYGKDALEYIQRYLDKYQGDGWRYMAFLKEVIKTNNFDFRERMREIYNN